MLFFTDSTGPDLDALGKALMKLLELGQQTSEAAIASLQQSNFSDAAIISELLPPQQHASFKRDRVITLNNVRVFMITKRYRAAAFTAGSILAMHVSLDFLEEIMKNCKRGFLAALYGSC